MELTVSNPTPSVWTSESTVELHSYTSYVSTRLQVVDLKQEMRMTSEVYCIG